VERAEYRTLSELETTHWWFRTLRAVLLDVVGGLRLGTGARVLDAGCGTGANVAALASATSARVFGFDIAPEAARHWTVRRGAMCLASVNEVAFASGAFDAALAVDVLESDAVRPVAAYRELLRVLRPGGHLIVIVPAYRWMLSPEHHRAVHASRRYTRRTLGTLLAEAPATVVRVSHIFATLFPAIAAYRLYKRAAPAMRNGAPRSEVWPLPAPVNAALVGLMSVERRLLRRMDLPWGSSILAVVRKA
jgi:SAM-dependent methyltransferase